MATDAGASNSRQWWDRPESIRYKLADRFGRRWPKWIDRPFVCAERAYYAAQDPLMDQAFPPEEASVELHGIWAVEVFTPANIEGLMSRVKELGWDGEEVGGIHNVAEWLREARDGHFGTKKLHIRRPETGSLVTLKLPLPSFVQCVEGELETVSRSVTRLSLFFGAKIEERQQLNRALRATYQTRITATKRGASISNPERCRIEAVSEIRTRWRHEVRSWIRCYFPGLLSQALDTAMLPTCELAVIDGFEPFAQIGPEGAPKSGIARLVQMGFAWFTFEEAERDEQGLSSAKFAIGPWHSGALRHHSILAIPRVRYEGTVGALDPKSGEFRFAFEVDRMFRRTFGNWSLMAVVRHYEGLLSAAHDGAFNLLTSWRSLKVLKWLREITSRAADAKTVARELSDFSKSLTWYEGFDFMRQRYRPRETPESILQIMRERLGNLAANLEVNVGELNEFLHQQASLLSASANLRLQWVVGIFAFISIAVGIAALKPVAVWLGW